MIWALIRRDPASRWAMAYVIVFALLAAAWHFVASASGDTAALGSGAFVGQLFGLALAVYAQHNELPFEAMLPVSIRQLLIARLLAISALMWVPLLTGTMVLFIFGGLNASIMLAILPGPMPYILVVCWLVSLGIAAWTCGDIPESPHLEPAATRISSVTRTYGRTWTMLFRALSPKWVLVNLYLLAAVTALYSPVLIAFLVIPSSGWSSVKSGFRWMFSLPVAPRMMMAAIILPGPFMLLCGYLLGGRLPFIPWRVHHSDLRAQVLNATFVVVLSMLWNLLAMAVGWRPIRWIALAMLVAIAVCQIFVIGRDWADPLHWLSILLPASVPGAAGLAILVTAILFEAMVWLFRRLDLL